MSITRMAVFIGIMCSVWMTSPSTADAFGTFVELSGKRSTKVKKCVDGKGGNYSFSSTALNVGLDITSSGTNDFDAVWRFDVPTTPLFSGVWTQIGERNGVVTYQLTSGGDLTTISIVPSEVRDLEDDEDFTGWSDLLAFIRKDAGCACDRISKLCDFPDDPTQIFPALSDFVKGILVVHANEDSEIDCPEDQRPCYKAEFSLDVKAFMDGESDGWGSAKTDWVRFKYVAKGYVWNAPIATPTPTPTATPTTTPTATATATPTPTP